jgi:hypothetical protein
MSDQFIETSTTSWGKRIIGALKGIVFGLLFFIGSFCLIWWNEGRSVARIKTLSEGRKAVISVSADDLNNSNNGSLIHISGIADTNQVLDDSMFGVQDSALKLRRQVEMYQWQEHTETKTKKNVGGSETTETVYTYRKEWSENYIDSSYFKKIAEHQNPSSMPYHSKTMVASDIKVGVFELSNAFVSKIDYFSDYPLSQQNFDAMDGGLQQSFQLNGTEYFYGNPSNPEIGSVRIRYKIIKPMDISVVGKQNGNFIEKYITKHGEIVLVEQGIVTAEEMFNTAESENALMTWLIRLGGFVLMWLGLSLILGPLKVFADVIPFMGSIVGAGVGAVTGLIALALSFTTMALAWLFFRPVIGITLLVVALFFLFGGFKFVKRKNEARINIDTDMVNASAYMSPPPPPPQSPPPIPN